jgi:hypothetical protein
MSTEKLVFSQLFKTELATQKVELGLVDDINKSRIETDKIEDSAIAEITKAISILDNGSKILDKSILSAKSVIDQIDKAKIMAKDLGIALPPNLDTTYKYYQDSIKSYNLMKSTISSFSSKIDSI